ncbi:MAG: GGDEF domain-containing protein, partial [Actinomycetota bacterium]
MTGEPVRVDPMLSDRPWVGRLLRGPVGAGRVSGAVSIAVQLVACLVLGWLVGGTDRVAPNWFYLPIAFAALRFGVRGALVTAITAGVLAGPLTAADVAAGRAQPVAEQISQAIAFVVIGVGLALLVEQAVARTRRRMSGLELSDRLLAAIEDGHVTVEYQAVWASSGHELVGAEALVRWVDPGQGALPPGTFVPLLEDSGQLDRLGLWVLDQACADAARWQRAGLAGPTFRVAVNVSSVQLDDRFHEHVVHTLADHDLDPGTLVLELTERTVLDDQATATSVLARIRALGVQIAIDDFGTGFSSLAYLRDLEFDILKLDRAFIATLGSERAAEDRVDGAIVGAVIGLATELDKTVVVEGVESVAQLGRLRELGAHHLQGSMLAGPEPSEQFGERLAARTPRSGRLPAPREPVPPIEEPDQPRSRRERMTEWLSREIGLASLAEGVTHGSPASVILAGMFLAGSLITVAVALFSDLPNESVTVTLGLLGLPCGLYLHHQRGRVPEWLLHGLLLTALLIVVSAVAVDTTPTTKVANSTFIVWICIFASAFFSVRHAVVHGVIAGAALGTVFHLMPLEQDAAVWIIIMGTAGVAGFVVGWFSRQLRLLAATDPLTGLPNRQSFESMMQSEIDRAERSNTPLAVALVDLDDFKAINDTEGHLAGDRVLAGL